MGSDDDTYVTDPMLPVQEPKSASGANTKSSDGQVQNLKDQCDNFMDVPMGPDDNLIDETKAPVKVLDITSVASMRPGHGADPTSSVSSGGGDGSGTWSLTEEEQVRNLRNNFRRAFCKDWSERRWALYFKDHPWFVEVVAKVRADPFLNNLNRVRIGKGPFQVVHVTPLHLAVLMGDLEMVQKILETHSGPNEGHIDSLMQVLLLRWETYYSALDLAIVGGESKIVDALLEKNAKVNTSYEDSLQLAVLHACADKTEQTSKIIQSLVRHGVDIKAKDHNGYSAFYLAVAEGKTNIVNELLKWKDKILLNEACRGGRPPIQIAHDEGFKDIESALMACDDVQWYIDSTNKERQGYVDTANAILVGAAFIASATFASWLQPPLNYTTSYHDSSVEYVDVEHNIALGIFWVFNSLSFYFAVGTVVLGASSVLPRRQLFIIAHVKKLSQNLILMSIFLAFSMIFVVIAFGIAGFIVLIPILRYRWYMIAPTILGGIVCVGSIGYLFKSLWDHRPWNVENRKRNANESNDIGSRYRYRYSDELLDVQGSDGE